MKKIAYILTPVEFGGAEKVSINFLKNVNKKDFRVYPIILVRPWENRNEFIEKIEKDHWEYVSIPVAKKALGEGKDYFRVLRCFRILFSMLRKGRYDLIHTNGYFADIIAIPACSLLGIPQIATCHGFINNDRKLRFYNGLDRFALRFSKRIIAVSDRIKEELVKHGIKESRIIVIKNAVDGNYHMELFNENRQKKRKRLNIEDDEFVLGYLGRLSKEKGIIYLIHASSMLNEMGVPIKTLIIGEGPHKKELEELVKRRGIENRFIFAGFQNDVENWMPAIDVFILPSLTEGTPMALLEAMACGIPVVASAVGGIPQVIVSDKNGILVTPGKPEEIANAVNTLYGNQTLRRTIAEEAKTTIRLKYDVSDWIKRIETEYLNMILKAEK